MINTDEDKTLYGFIKSQIPYVEGYGDCGKVISEDGQINHSVWYQNIREDKEGDIGIFIITTQENTELMYGKVYNSEVQIVVNSVNGDLAGVLDMLLQTFENIKTNKKNDYISVSKCGLINLRPVGKNSNGLQWSVLNILCKYTVTK